MPVLVYIRIFAVQAVLVSLVMVVFLAAVLSNKYNIILLISGLSLWLFGLIFESIADMQLKRHIAYKPGELMKTGLWKYSRHPNYFGELTQWWAIWLMLAGGVYAVVGLVGPISIFLLIIFVSGIPPLEKHMASKKGWEEYKKSTSMIIPWHNLHKNY
jgi:steroid 5-alpha reductase family enzyme